MNQSFEYGGYYKRYNMDGDIQVGRLGIVKVHNIFDKLPNFMVLADCLFIDPPCSDGNLKSFYTKSNLECLCNIHEFTKRLWECIDIIKPNTVFIEVFKSNYDLMLDYFKIFSNGNKIKITEHTYYKNNKNRCYIFSYSHLHNLDQLNNLKDGIDEQKAIEIICRDMEFSIIGDLCMGRGLLGYYAYKYNRPFVGTELNKKRLAVMLNRIETGKL